MNFAPGEKMPFCFGLDRERQFYSFEAQAGRDAVLILGGGVPEAALDPVLAALAAVRGALAADVVLLRDPSAAPHVFQSTADPDPGLTTVVCPDDYFARCGTSAVVVIDRAARVTATWDLRERDPASLAAAALEAVGRLAREPARECALPAPLLAIPGLLEAPLCQALIAAFEAAPHFDSLVSGIDRTGKPHSRLDPSRKRRRDWLLQPEDALLEPVRQRLLARCAPEIRRAFQHEVTHLDRVLVARYDDTGGYFRRHRDNAAASVAFRQFALSVNLNAGDYEGGQLMFPEFNDHRHAPRTGEGLVFSASLLHEALPVVRGQRYVLLTFLHDLAAERQRLAAAPEAQVT